MYRGAICPPFLARYVWHYPFPLEEGDMAMAAAVVVGEHDFTSFAAVDPERSERIAVGEILNQRGQGGARGETAESKGRTIFSSAGTREGEDLIYTFPG